MQTTVVTSLSYEELKTLISEALRGELKQIAPPSGKGEMPPGEAGQFISKRAAARLLDCCVSTIDNHARAGRLKRHYIGRAVRFERVQVLGLARAPSNKIQHGTKK